MKIIDFIFCDDIRHEMGNKITIVGAYNDKIEFQPAPGHDIKWPVNIRMGTYIRLLLEKDKKFDEIEISITLSAKEIINLKANIQYNPDEQNSPIILSFVAPSLTLDGPGKVEIKANLFYQQKIVEVVKPNLNFSVVVKNSKN